MLFFKNSVQLRMFVYESKHVWLQRFPHTALPPENMKGCFNHFWKLPINGSRERTLGRKALCDVGLHWVKLQSRAFALHYLFHKSHHSTVNRQGPMYGFLSVAHHKVLLTVDILAHPGRRRPHFLGAPRAQTFWVRPHRWLRECGIFRSQHEPPY